MTDGNRFRSELLSITPAQPGWQIRVQREEWDPATKQTQVEVEGVFPIVTWGLVKRWYEDSDPDNAVEAVFLTDSGRTMHETFFRWMYSDLKPRPGEPKVTIDFKILPPPGAAAGA